MDAEKNVFPYGCGGEKFKHPKLKKTESRRPHETAYPSTEKRKEKKIQSGRDVAESKSKTKGHPCALPPFLNATGDKKRGHSIPVIPGVSKLQKA